MWKVKTIQNERLTTGRYVFYEHYKFAWFLYLELYNYTNIVANGFIISKLSNLVALHELLLCDIFFIFIFIFFAKTT